MIGNGCLSGFLWEVFGQMFPAKFLEQPTSQGGKSVGASVVRLLFKPGVFELQMECNPWMVELGLPFLDCHVFLDECFFCGLTLL